MQRRSLRCSVMRWNTRRYHCENGRPHVCGRPFFLRDRIQNMPAAMPRSGQLQPQPQLSPEPHTLFTSDCSVPFLHMQYARAARSGQPQPLNALEENTFPHVPRMSRIMRIQRQRLPPKQQFIVFPPIAFPQTGVWREIAAEYVTFVFCGPLLYSMTHAENVFAKGEKSCSG